jgi:hypothetical protein
MTEGVRLGNSFDNLEFTNIKWSEKVTALDVFLAQK